MDDLILESEPLGRIFTAFRDLAKYCAFSNDSHALKARAQAERTSRVKRPVYLLLYQDLSEICASCQRLGSLLSRDDGTHASIRNVLRSLADLVVSSEDAKAWIKTCGRTQHQIYTNSEL
jgi:hypothetical protein